MVRPSYKNLQVVSCFASCEIYQSNHEPNLNVLIAQFKIHICMCKFFNASKSFHGSLYRMMKNTKLCVSLTSVQPNVVFHILYIMAKC